MIKVNFYDIVEDAQLKFAFIIAKKDGNWIFCKHKERDTWECPGGHREMGEDINDTVRRELYQNIKFVSGGILFWLVSIILLFSKNNQDGLFKKIFNKFLSTLLCAAIGYILALTGKNIPTFINVWVNAILFPIIQIAFIGLLVYGTKGNNKK